MSAPAQSLAGALAALDRATDHLWEFAEDRGVAKILSAISGQGGAALEGNGGAAGGQGDGGASTRRRRLNSRSEFP